jgi:hypothetical protein
MLPPDRSGIANAGRDSLAVGPNPNWRLRIRGTENELESSNSPQLAGRQLRKREFFNTRTRYPNKTSL